VPPTSVTCTRNQRGDILPQPSRPAPSIIGRLDSMSRRSSHLQQVSDSYKHHVRMKLQISYVIETKHLSNLPLLYTMHNVQHAFFYSFINEQGRTTGETHIWVFPFTIICTEIHGIE
jgi:hypothetical protein